MSRPAHRPCLVTIGAASNCLCPFCIIDHSSIALASLGTVVGESNAPVLLTPTVIGLRIDLQDLACLGNVLPFTKLNIWLAKFGDDLIGRVSFLVHESLLSGLRPDQFSHFSRRSFIGYDHSEFSP